MTASAAPVAGVGVEVLSEVFGVRFSDEQLAAITAPLEPYVVVAGAGSGKTTVMAARVVWLVTRGLVRPEEILGLTFTTKAAGELSSRIRRCLARLDDVPGIADPGESDGEPTVSTYHAFAGRLIADHGLRLGVEPGSRLLTNGTAQQLVHRVVARTSQDLAGYGAGLPHVVEAVIKLDGELAEHLVEPGELRTFDEALLLRLADVPRPTAKIKDAVRAARNRVTLAHLVDEVRAAKSARDLLDFADQIRVGARLALEHPQVGEALRAQFRVVLLDEYQDTSVAQRVLLAALFGDAHPVTAVGDPLQAIYGWRGASVANIDGFPEHFRRADSSPARVLPLSENRRSGSTILAAANTLAEPLREVHPQVRPLVPAGAKGAGGVRIALLETYSQELDWVADRVVEQVSAGTPHAEIAVLCRASADFLHVRAALAARGVPVEVLGVDGMLTAPEVVEVLAVLQVLADVDAGAALLRVLAGPRWRVGPRDLALLGARAARLAGDRHRAPLDADLAGRLDAAVAGGDPAELVSLLDALEDPGEAAYDPRARERFAALAAELRRLRRHVGEPLPDLVHRVVSTTGLDVELAASREVLDLHRAEGLAAFVDLVAGFVDAEGQSSLAAFLTWLATVRRYEAVPDLDRPVAPGAVQLMTVHRAKGLEFPVVVLPSLTRGVFPSTQGLPRWTRRADALPYPLRGDRISLPVMGEWSSQGVDEFTADCRAHEEQEERRLGYVAVTRAERLVIASGSWWGPTQTRRRGPSPYLVALREHCDGGGGHVDEWAAEPDDESQNPVLGQEIRLGWPVAPGSGAHQRRQAAARAVRDSPALTVPDLSAEHGGDLFSPLADLDPVELDEVEGWDEDVALLLTELEQRHSQVRTVPLPTTLSTSQLVRLADDEGEFARALARPMPAAPVAAARRGTRFHGWVEQHYAVRPLLAPDELPGAADDGIDSDAELAGLQEAFLRSDYADRTPVAVEVPFTLALGSRVVSGRIDAVFAGEGDRYEVVDWKTSKRQDADPLQLAVYRLAWSELAGVPVEQVDAAFGYVRTGQAVRPPDLPGRDELARLLR